jgi:YD repeat-containing protein
MYYFDVGAYSGSSTLHVRLKVNGSDSSDKLDVDNLLVTASAQVSASSDSYTYDAVGNRLTKNSTNYTYDDADQMTAAGGVSYGYDNNGNQTSRGGDSFAWNHENRMTSATIGGATSSYTYDADGLRSSRTVGAARPTTRSVGARACPSSSRAAARTTTTGGSAAYR